MNEQKKLHRPRKIKRTITGFLNVWWEVIHGLLCRVGRFWDFNWREGSPLARLAKGSNTSITISHNINASNPSTLKPVSNDITSPSVLLFDTAACVFHAHGIGTHVCMITKRTQQSTDVDLESVNCPATSASWKKPNLHSPTLSPNMTTSSLARSALKTTNESRQPFVTRSVPFRDTSS